MDSKVRSLAIERAKDAIDFARSIDCDIVICDEDAEMVITTVLGDKNAKVYLLY